MLARLEDEENQWLALEQEYAFDESTAISIAPDLALTAADQKLVELADRPTLTSSVNNGFEQFVTQAAEIAHAARTMQQRRDEISDSLNGLVRRIDKKVIA